MKFIYTFLSGLLILQATGQVPIVSAGTVVRYENFSSHFVSARTIDVWLPEGYNSSQHYPVLYMHDGQMLFDSSHTWTHTEWGVDETVSTLVKKKKIKPCIIVGIGNVGLERHADYFPQKPFESLTIQLQDSIYAASRANGYSIFNNKRVHSDAYLKFIVQELKPFIDSVYSTQKDKEHTFMAGSSMGGLISLYAICEYPEIFGGVACLSTHWPGVFTVEGNPIPDAFFGYMRQHLPDPLSHKIYFDYGDQTLDALYPSLQKKADQVMKDKGYGSTSWRTLFFPGENHSEVSWAKRFDQPLLFLMKK